MVSKSHVHMAAFRRVTANMDEMFVDAAPGDLESDNVCIICREEMTPTSRNKKLTCGHVFHLHCLRYAICHASFTLES